MSERLTLEQMIAPDSPVDGALEMLTLGIPVIPIYPVDHESLCTCYKRAACGKSAGKHPIPDEWEKPENQFHTEQEVRDYFATARCNFGGIMGQPLPDGRIAVTLDVDTDGKPGLESLAELQASGVAFDPTRKHRTGGGGFQLILGAPAGSQLKSRIGFMPGLDFIVGQIILPGSRSHKGLYKTVEPLPIADIPTSLLEIIETPKRGDANYSASVKDLKARAELSAEEIAICDKYQLEICVSVKNKLTALANVPVGGLPNWGVAVWQCARDMMRLANAPWSQVTKEYACELILAHAPRDVGYGEERIKASLRTAERSTEGEGTPLPLEADFWNRRESLAHIYADAKATRCSPMAELGVYLSRLSVAIPSRFRTPEIAGPGGGGTLNLLIALVGDPSDGKGTAESSGRTAIHIEMPESMYADPEDDPSGRGGMREEEPLTLGTGEGMAAAYMRRDRTPAVPRGIGEGGVEIPARPAGRQRLVQYRDRCRFVCHEVAFMATSNAKGGTLEEVTRKVWSGQGIGNQNRDPEKNLQTPEQKYRLSMTVDVQPGHAGALINELSVAGGTPHRYLWLSTFDPNIQDVKPARPEPVLRSIAPWGDGLAINQPHWEGSIWDTRYQAFDVCWQIVAEMDAEDVRRKRKQATVYGELGGHAMFNRLKIACLFAIDDGRWSVNEEDWELAGVLIQHSMRELKKLIDTSFAKKAKENEARGRARAVQEVMIKQGVEDSGMQKAIDRINILLGRQLAGVWMNGRDLRQACRRHNEWYDEALEVLIQRGAVLEMEVERVNSDIPAKKYKLA